MAQTPEAKVKEFVKKQMKTKYPDAWYYSPPGGMFGKAGVPDLFYLYKGVFIAIECKADSNSIVSALQKKALIALTGQGAVAAIIRGKDQDKMQKIFAAIDEKIKET